MLAFGCGGRRRAVAEPLASSLLTLGCTEQRRKGKVEQKFVLQPKVGKSGADAPRDKRGQLTPWDAGVWLWKSQESSCRPLGQQLVDPLDALRW
ncbi:unnamed protein product [Prunus armeniaca]